jgi:uncharacterized membrane protein YozB (DUF420 family)
MARSRADRLVPALLLVLCVVPTAAGTHRLVELIGGAAITADNARFFASPVPVVAHILTACTFCVLGVFQFSAGFRRRRPRWHRVAGRVVAPCGLVAALTGLWMTMRYPRPVGDGDLLDAFRLAVGTAMVASIVIGIVAITRRDVSAHGDWMLRGYAIGLGAGTQVVTNLPWVLLVGHPGVLARALLMGAGWAINLAVAEWIIHRRRAGQLRTRLVS